MLAEVRQGTREDALWFALSANKRHGLPMSPEDKRKAVRLLLGVEKWAGMSNAAIAKELGISDHTVADVKREMGHPTSQSARLEGKTEGTDGKYRSAPGDASDLVRSALGDPGFAKMSNAAIAKQLKVSPSTVAKVRKLMASAPTEDTAPPSKPAPPTRHPLLDEIDGAADVRALAHEKAGLVDILADVRDGSKRDALLFAVGANATHGLARSNKDKRRAVEILLRDEEWASKSDRQIAGKALVHHELVGSVRAEMRKQLADSANCPEPTTRTGKDGKQYPTRKIKTVEAPVKTGAEPDEYTPPPTGPSSNAGTMRLCQSVRPHPSRHPSSSSRTPASTSPTSATCAATSTAPGRSPRPTSSSASRRHSPR